MLPLLTIVVPAYNEAGILPDLLLRLKEINRRYPEIYFIIVENGSTDKSREILTDFCDRNKDIIKVVFVDENTGYGAGLRSGLAESNTQMVGWMHSDLECDPEVILQFLPLVADGAVFIKGRRYSRRLSDACFTSLMGALSSIALGQKMFDINAHPTVIDRSLLGDIGRSPSDFNFELWAYHNALKSGAKVARVPVVIKPRTHGTSSWNFGLKSRIKMAINVCKTLIKLRGEQ